MKPLPIDWRESVTVPIYENIGSFLRKSTQEFNSQASAFTRFAVIILLRVSGALERCKRKTQTGFWWRCIDQVFIL